MAYMLATVEDVKAWQKGELDNSLDGLIGRILAGVTTRFAQVCGREWDRKSYSLLFSPSGRTKYLWLVNTPIASTPVPQVWEHADSDFTGSPLPMGEDYKLVYESGMVVRMGAPWLAGINTVKAVYTGGYLTGHGLGAPDDLRLLAIMQASFLFQRRAELGIVSQSTEGGALTMQRDIELLPEVKAGLQPYMVNLRLF